MRIPCRSVGRPCSISVAVITTPDRVGGIETATIELADNQRLTSILISIYHDRAIDATTQVVTTKDTSELTTGNCQIDITVDSSILGTTEHLRNEIFRHTVQLNDDIAIHWSHLTGTVDFANYQVTRIGISIFSLQRCSSTYVTLGITTAIYVTNLTTNQLCLCDTSTIDTICGVSFIGSCINNTHISSRVARARSITTTKQITNNVGTFNSN